MCPVIKISDDLYKRLENYAEGFDTPAAVIERVLNIHEGKSPSDDDNLDHAIAAKPKVIFHPSDEKEFLRRLVENGSAYVRVLKRDGSLDTSEWHASRMTLDSNLRANIWSGRLRDWKEKGIVKAEFAIDRGDFFNDPHSV